MKLSVAVSVIISLLKHLCVIFTVSIGLKIVIIYKLGDGHPIEVQTHTGHSIA